MKARVVVDASVWVSWLRPSEVHYQASNRWMNQYRSIEGSLIVPAFLLVEVAATMSRLTGQSAHAKEVIHKITLIDTIQIFPMDAVFIEAIIDIAADLRLRAGDATYVALAHQLSIPLISWDKEQLERASSLVTTFTPDTYVFEAGEEETGTET